MSEVDLYGAQLDNPRYVKRESGLIMPGTLEEALATIDDVLYLLPHHFVDFSKQALELPYPMGHDLLTFMRFAISDMVAPHDYQLGPDRPLNMDYPYTEIDGIEQIKGVRHSYRDDISKNRGIGNRVIGRFVNRLAQNDSLVVGINNRYDPLCITQNLGGIGSHCHLQWMLSQQDLSVPAQNSAHRDSGRMLGVVKWFAFASQVYNKDMVLELGFLANIHSGQLQLFVEQAEVYGQSYSIPELHIPTQLLLNLDRELVYDYLRVLFNPMGIGNIIDELEIKDRSTKRVAKQIENEVTLNNWQNYLAT